MHRDRGTSGRSARALMSYMAMRLPRPTTSIAMAFSSTAMRAPLPFERGVGSATETPCTGNSRSNSLRAWSEALDA